MQNYKPLVTNEGQRNNIIPNRFWEPVRSENYSNRKPEKLGGTEVQPEETNIQKS